MSHNNGTRLFLYVFLLKRAGEVQAYLLRCDRDPTTNEFYRLFALKPEPDDQVQAARYEYDHLPVVPPNQ